MSPFRLFTIILFLVLAAPGCAETHPPDPGPAADPVLRFSMVGGFAGLNRQYAVFADGRVRDVSGQVRQLTQGRVGELLEELERLGFFTWDARYFPRDPCCDRYEFELWASRQGRSHEVHALSGTPGAPANLWLAIERVRQVIEAPASAPEN